MGKRLVQPHSETMKLNSVRPGSNGRKSRRLCKYRMILAEVKLKRALYGMSIAFLVYDENVCQKQPKEGKINFGPQSQSLEAKEVLHMVTGGCSEGFSFSAVSAHDWSITELSDNLQRHPCPLNCLYSSLKSSVPRLKGLLPCEAEPPTGGQGLQTQPCGTRHIQTITSVGLPGYEVCLKDDRT